MGGLVELYEDFMTDRPMLTQICTAGLMTTFGDVLAQFIERRSLHNIRRTFIMATLGFLYVGPFVTCWLLFLGMNEFPVFVNVLLDQFVAAPPLLCGFLIFQSLLNGQSAAKIQNRLANEVTDILKMNWIVWIPVQFVNFQIIPVQFRMLFNQVISLFWNCYISSKTSGSNNKQSDKEKKT